MVNLYYIYILYTYYKYILYIMLCIKLDGVINEFITGNKETNKNNIWLQVNNFCQTSFKSLSAKYLNCFLEFELPWKLLGIQSSQKMWIDWLNYYVCIFKSLSGLAKGKLTRFWLQNVGGVEWLSYWNTELIVQGQAPIPYTICHGSSVSILGGNQRLMGTCRGCNYE